MQVVCYFEDGHQLKQIKTWVDGKVNRETKYYQNGKQRYDRVAQGDHFLITEFYDSGNTESRGTYKPAINLYQSGYSPDGVIESFNEDGKLRSRETYVKGRLQGQSDSYWERKNHKVHEESHYKNDTLVRKKLFVDDKPISESEFMPDGSIKSRKNLGKTELPGFDI